MTVVRYHGALVALHWLLGFMILLGLFMALILKFLLFVALPVTLGWLIIRAMRNANAHQHDAPAPPPAAEPIQTL